MAGLKLTLNLASRSYLNRRALYAFYAVLGALLIVLLGMNLGYYFRSQAQARQIQGHLVVLEQEMNKEQPAVKVNFTQAEYENLLGEITFANNILRKDSFRWTELLNRLEEVLPEGVTIRGLQPEFKEEGLLNLTGLARNVGDLRLFLDNLIRSPHFKDVYLLQQSLLSLRGNGREREAVSFKIVLKGAF